MPIVILWYPNLCFSCPWPKSPATFNIFLGKVGLFINSVALAWIFLAIVLFCLPTAKHLTPSTMNYASAVFAGFALISIFWYVIRGRKNFTGPPVPSDVEIEHDGQVIGQLGRTTTKRENTSIRISRQKSK